MPFHREKLKNTSIFVKTGTWLNSPAASKASSDLKDLFVDEVLKCIDGHILSMHFFSTKSSALFFLRLDPMSDIIMIRHFDDADKLSKTHGVI